MEDFKELSREDFMWTLLLMLLLRTEETNEMLKKYVEKEKPTEV